MLFNSVLVEKNITDEKLVKDILSRLPDSTEKIEIDSFEKVFGAVKKPYLQKRENLNLILAHKKGKLVKQAPDAYGLEGSPHYYFVHAYNCIYECEYCYLQGYFNSPDIVIFTNRDEIQNQIIETYNQHQNEDEIWFHAGEFSDSLALSHITQECEFYWEVFSKLPKAKLELRTKSANIKSLKNLKPQPNVIVSYSLSPEFQLKSYDRKTATYKQRIKCVKELSELGHPVGLHLDPIIYTPDFKQHYEQLFEDLKANIDLQKLCYISLGVVRFSKDVYAQLEKNYPSSNLHQQNFTTGFDQKKRYSRPLRLWMLNQVKNICLSYDIDPQKVYLCMEE